MKRKDIFRCRGAFLRCCTSIDRDTHRREVGSRELIAVLKLLTPAKAMTLECIYIHLEGRRKKKHPHESPGGSMESRNIYRQED